MVNATCDYDSILTATDSNVINTSEFYSLGGNLSGHVFGMTERIYSVSSDGILTLLLLLSLGLISAIVYRSRNYIIHNFQQFFRSERKFALAEVNTKNFWLNSVVLILVSYISIAVVLFNFLVSRYGFSQILGIPYWLIGATVLLLSMLFLFKVIVYTVVNWVFFQPEPSERWMSSYVFISSMFAFPCFVLTLCNLYSTISVEMVFLVYGILVSFFEILLIFKLFINFRTKKRGAFLIFLYLCSAEFVPNLIMWKLLLWACNDFIEENVLY